MTRPLIFQWTGEAMIPANAWNARQCDEHYVIGGRYKLAPVEDRSMASHRHAFAWLHEAWNSLPEEYGMEAWAANPETLRKFALIRTGFCTTQIFTCGSRAEAQRWAANLRGLREDFCIVAPKGSTVQVFTAKSQSTRAMDKQEFEASKKAILDFIAGLIGVEPETLAKQEGAA